LDSSGPIFKGQIAFSSFIKKIVELAHQDMGWWKKYKLLRSLSYPYFMWQHIQECNDCRPVLGEALRQVEIFTESSLIPPEIVAREDGEKALRYLAYINNMNEQDFRKWVDETSDRVIKKINQDS
jgi:hypothetical protein